MELHAPRGHFCSPNGPRSRWSSISKALVAFCLWVHRTVQCTPDSELCNSYKIPDWLVSYSRGHQTVQWGAPDCPVLMLTIGPRPMWQLAVDGGTLDCPVIHVDGPVNYSRCRQEFSRGGSWPHYAPFRLVRGTVPPGALQSSTRFPFSFLISFAPFVFTS
jgi:hypothetical protein